MSVLVEKSRTPRRPREADSPSARQGGIEMPGALRLLTTCLILIVCSAGVYYGLQLRRYTYELTKPLRFTYDIERGYYWGVQATKEGYPNLYERMASRQEPGSHLFLDYCPLRLAVMWQWARWNQANLPAAKAETWQPDYEFTRPVLWFNTGMELLAALGAFLLTRHWVRRQDETPGVRARWYVRLRDRWRGGTPATDTEAPQLAGSQQPFRGWGRGLVAAGLVWFNPGMIVSAHGWPTWDMWIIPFYLYAILLASLEWWFLAGLMIATGAMFKGQQFLVAPVFVIWPLVMGRTRRVTGAWGEVVSWGGGWPAALKWLAGLVLGVAAWTSVWLITYLPSAATEGVRLYDWRAIAWIGGIGLAAFLTPWLTHLEAPARWFKTPRRWRGFCLLIGALLAVEVWVWPFYGGAGSSGGGVMARTVGWYDLLPGRAGWGVMSAFLPALGLAALFFLVVCFLKRRQTWYLAAASVGVALLLTMSWFHGSRAWIDCGFLYATEHWPQMAVGKASNLPAILQQQFGLAEGGAKTTLLTLAPHSLWLWPSQGVEVSYRVLLWLCYGVTLLAAGIGMGLQARRNSVRFLVALTTPWLLLYCIPAQMHERYLLFAAGIGAVMVGWRWGVSLLVVFLGVETWVMTTHCMFIRETSVPARVYGETVTQNFMRAFDGTCPGIGWAVLFAALLCLYWTLTFDRPRVPRVED